MNIGLILDDTLDKYDGVQQAVIAIGQEFTKRGHVVHYIVPNTIRTDLPNVHSMGKYVSVRFNGNSVRTPLPIRKKKILKFYKSLNIDILHVQMPYSPVFAARFLSLAPRKTKIFGTFHILPYGKISEYSTKILGIMLKVNNKLINKSFAVSEPSLKFMESTLGLRGTVIPNPVDFSFYRSFKKQPKKNKQIVYVGRFEERKGVEELAEAYGKLTIKIRSKTDLVMCGKGPLLEKIVQFSNKKKLGIKFAGYVTETEKAQFLANADIAIFPSKAGESFGIVLLEAMSSRAGITIGGNNPGYSSVLNKWPETLFNPRDTKEISEILKLYLTNDELRLRIGQKQQADVAKYDIKVVASSLLKEYST